MLIKRRSLLAASGAAALTAPSILAPAWRSRSRSSWPARVTTCANSIVGGARRAQQHHATALRGCPSTPARSIASRTAGSTRGIDAPFTAYVQQREVLPIETSKLKGWDKIVPGLKDGQAAPGAPLGIGADPSRMMYLDEARTKISSCRASFR